MEEEWRIIKGFSNYEVSNTGFVRNANTYYILKNRITKNGYCQVSLKDDITGKFKNQYIHRLVALAFIENPEDKVYVNHKDGNKTNNNISNLEWSTPGENQHHRHVILNKRITSNRKIGMFDKITGEKIKEFNSILEGAAYFGKDSRENIDNALSHKKGQQTAYGYVWKYLD